MLAVLSSQMKDALVEGGKDQPVMNCQAQQEGICYLFVAMQALKEGLRQRAPIVSNAMVMVTSMARQFVQYTRRFSHAETLGAGRVAQEAGFRPRAEGPLQARSFEPLHRMAMMLMAFKEARDQHIYIDQVKGLTQDLPPTPPSLFPK